MYRTASIAHGPIGCWTESWRGSSKTGTAPCLRAQDVLTKEFSVSRSVPREALSIVSPRERDEHLASKVLFLRHEGRCPCVCAGT
ncbi:hypothetical protein R75461_08419 [Paraburkholderia nemoris]|nr:hypothetical protein R75461_08419 [Paraburkholderia nemoris]